MRKRIALLCLVTMALALFAGCPIGSAAGKPRIVLITCYMQAGWGDRIEIGFVDEEGGLWAFSRESNDIGFPYSDTEQLEFLAKSSLPESVGTLTKETFEDVKSLVACVEGEATDTGYGACDAGTQRSCAVRYSKDGDPEILFLGSSGDSVWENADSNAVALYSLLRDWFPGVTDYESNAQMSPKSFVPQSLLSFCGYGDFDLDGATVSLCDMDCEAGPIEREISEDDAAELLESLRNAVVTGKKNAFSVTGGYESIQIRDKSGEKTAYIALYRGALMRSDGMYALTGME